MGRYTNIVLVTDDEEPAANIEAVKAWLQKNTAHFWLNESTAEDGDGFPFDLMTNWIGQAKNMHLADFSRAVSAVRWEDPDCVFLTMRDEQDDRPAEWRNGRKLTDIAVTED